MSLASPRARLGASGRGRILSSAKSRRTLSRCEALATTPLLPEDFLLLSIMLITRIV